MTIEYQDQVLEQVPTGNTIVYTAPNNVKSAHIIFANCTCEDATGDSITINLVQSGDSAGTTNLYVDAKGVSAGSTEILSEIIGAVIKPGGFVSASAATSGRLNLKLGIKEFY